MAELAALNVKISGDSGGLVAAVNSAEGSLTSFGRVTTAAEANARGFDRSLRNTGGAATSLQQRINSLTGVMSQSRRSAEASARAFDGLSNEALQSASQMAAAARQAQAYGTQATGASFQTANLAAQFNDIGVMLAAGQSPLMLALQQGTQINQVFGQMGTGASRLRMLGSALMSVVSPANLVTIGIIAGGAALVQFGMNAFAARDQASDLADTLSTLNDIQTTLNGANEILAMTTEELTEKYGDYADEVRRAAESIAILAEAQAIQATRDALADLGSEFGRLTSSGRTFDTAMTVALERIQQQFRVGYRDAQALNSAFVTLETATTFDAQVEALRNIERVMAETGANAADLPPSLLNALQQLNQMVITTGALSEGFKEASENAAMMLPTLNFDSEDPSSGGGGGVSLADRIERDLERLREGFMSEEELQIAAYASQQEILQSALEQRLITQQEYNDLIQQTEHAHLSAMDQLHRASANQTLGQYGTLFGNMATIFAAGGDKLVGITKAFSIAQGLLNSYRAFTEVLADPALIGRPFLRTALAASTLGAGLAQVANMRSIGGGGGGAGGAAAGISASAGAASSAQLPTQTLRFDFGGQNTMGMEQMVNLLNDAYDRGYRIRAVMA